MVQSSTTGGLRDAVGATADVVAAFASAGFLVGLPLAVAADLLGGPIAESAVPAVTAVVGVAFAYVFVAGSPPLALLTDFALAALLSFVVFAGLAVVVLAPLGGVETGSTADGVVRGASVAVAYAAGAAYVTVRRRRHETETRPGERSA
mgnify:CR=1 FL=1